MDTRQNMEARARAKLAQLQCIKTGLSSDMRKVEARLRKINDKVDIGQLERRWRWLNARICQIETLERSIRNSILTGS